MSPPSALACIFQLSYIVDGERTEKYHPERDNTNEKPKTEGQHYREDNEIATKTSTELKNKKTKANLQPVNDATVCHIYNIYKYLFMSA